MVSLCSVVAASSHTATSSVVCRVETAQLKRQVRRNIERFEGDDFKFEMTADELSKCQIGTLNTKKELLQVYEALTQLGEKENEPREPIGYTAIQERREKEEKK